MKQLDGKTAIVTGAGIAKGIGHAIAMALGAEGANLVVVDLAQTAKSLAVTIDQLNGIGCNAIACHVDVTDKVQIDDCINRTIEELGSIDILANNAGVAIGAPGFLDQTSADWDTTFAVNVKGLAQFAQAVIPQMQAQGGGVIINTASLSGLRNIPPTPPCYTASKFAVIGITKSIAQEFGADGIRCNAICPGSVDTDMREIAMRNIAGQSGISLEDAEREENAIISLGRPAAPGEIAAMVAFLAGPGGSYVTGAAIPIDGGINTGL